jgi:hypothetical protein
MRATVTFAVAVGILSSMAGAAVAQQAPTAYVMSAYYRCNQETEAKADTVMMKSLAAIYDRHMAAGEITSWAWLAHSIGGNWRRVGYFMAPTRDQLLDARAKIVAEVGALSQKTPGQNLASYCPSHDDYIWAMMFSSEPGASPGPRQPVGVSTYYECDMGREARADQIFETVLAPIYNKHMQAGHLASWGWARHDIGGRARRLGTLQAADAKSALNAWDMVFQEASQTAPLAFQEFLSICPAHNDYVWNTVIAKP